MADVDQRFFVYILATRKDGPLYVGVTNNLPGRIAQHKAHLVDDFTKRFNVDRPVWFEPHENAEAAITRESRSSGGGARGRWG